MVKYKLSTNDALVLKENVLGKISVFPSIAVNYQISKLINELEIISSSFKDQQKNLIIKYGKESEEQKGSFSIKESSPEDQKTYEDEILKILVSEVELSFDFNILDSIVKNEDFQIEEKEQSTLYSNLFQILLKSEVKGKK